MIERKTKPDSMVYLDSDHYGGDDGLTKREYFAAIAMQGLLVEGESYFEATHAEIAVKHADELIAELNK